MKYLLFAIGLFLCPFTSFSQSKYIESFIDKYADEADMNSLTLNDWTLQLTSSFTKKETGERIKNKITKLRLLSSENQLLAKREDIRNLMQNLRNDDFEDLMEVRDKGSNVKFMLRENKDYVTDVVMLVHGKEGFVLLTLEGLFKLEDLKDWNIEIDGSEHLKKINHSKA